MTEQDKFWIEKCKNDWNYTICVDNDEIFVVHTDTDGVLFFITSENKIACLKIVDILDFINRQRAEIERLEEILGGTSKVLAETCAVVRAEAIKEFVERVKKESSSFVACNGDHVIEETRSYQISGIKLDKLVEEMVGEF